MTASVSGSSQPDAANIHLGFSDALRITLAPFVADLLSFGALLIKDSVAWTSDWASGNTFTVCSGTFQNAVVAIMYVNFQAPLGGSSSELRENPREREVGECIAWVCIMANGILRCCPNVVGLRGIFFEVDDPARIRPALVVDLTDKQIPTLTECPKRLLSPLVKRSLITNLFGGRYAMHSVTIGHADIKPDNILVFQSCDNLDIEYLVKGSDFAFAFVSGQKPRGSGTAGWAAPECFRQTKIVALSCE